MDQWPHYASMTITKTALMGKYRLYVNFCGDHRELDLGVVRVLAHHAA